MEAKKSLFMEQRKNIADLGITFEVNGEKVNFFLPENVLKSKTRADLKALLLEGDEIVCAIGCAQKASYALCFARCMRDGKCCDAGATNCD